jgi:hypothetical protein
MGVDGTNTLTIRGPSADLDILESSYLVLPNADSVCKHGQSIVRNLLGGLNVEIIYRKPYCLKLCYPYRNETIYEYLKQLLKAHPKCWMKNEFITEYGNCGIWIASMVKNEPAIQEIEWSELSIEDCEGGRVNFSA